MAKTEQFFARVYKVHDVGHRTITLHIEAYDDTQKKIILQKLRNLGITIGPKKANNIVVYFGLRKSDFKLGNEK